MENYEQKYKEVLEKAKQKLDACGYLESRQAQMILELFPELEESKDEKIRKALVDGFFKYSNSFTTFGGIKVEDIISWLEKQKPVEHFELKAGHWYFCHQAFCCRADDLTVKEGERFMCEKDGVVKGFIIKDPEKYFIEIDAPESHDEKQKPIDIDYGNAFDEFISHIPEKDPDSCNSLYTYEDIEAAIKFGIQWHKQQKPVEWRPNRPNGYIAYDRGFEEAQEYISQRGFDIPWNDNDVFIDGRHITQTVANVLTWADEHPKQKPIEWTEEDAEILNGITNYLCFSSDAPELEGFERWYDWLKSLKERIKK